MQKPHLVLYCRRKSHPPMSLDRVTLKEALPRPASYFPKVRKVTLHVPLRLELRTDARHPTEALSLSLCITFIHLSDSSTAASPCPGPALLLHLRCSRLLDATRPSSPPYPSPEAAPGMSAHAWTQRFFFSSCSSSSSSDPSSLRSSLSALPLTAMRAATRRMRYIQ